MNEEVAVIGAGPAGLFASECLLAKGFCVSLYDRMLSPGCKFLVAGNHGGLNITNAADPDSFADRYGANRERFARLLEDFSPAGMIDWLASLGVPVHQGSGGKIFPEGAGAPEILSRWMERLRSYPLFSFFPGFRLSAIGADKVLAFETPSGRIDLSPDLAVFALGGASWPKTGSDGAWADDFRALGIEIAPFLPANCGFEAGWPDFLKERFANVPLKNISMEACGKTARGELMLTPYGIEGGVVYTLGSAIRDEIIASRSCVVHIDLFPDRTAENLESRLAGDRGKESISNWLRKKLGLDRVSFSLLREAAGDSYNLRDPAIAARLSKRIPVTLFRPRPIEEAISSAGGVSFSGLDENLMLKAYPGWFCAGEMLDWEAPTGGFLLQGCFSTGCRAAKGVIAWKGKMDAGRPLIP